MGPTPKRMKIDRKLPSALTLNITLSFLAGYVDAVGFMALFGLFTAHITGNLVLLGAELATPEHTFPLLKILAFPAFILGVALATMIASACEKKERNALIILYVVEMTFLMAFVLVGLVAGPIEENMSSAAISAGIIGTLAMGVHSACGRLLLPDLAPTVMMTGNVTQLVVEFFQYLKEDSDKTRFGKCAKYLWPIIAFGIGSLIAAFAYLRFGFHALWLPIALVLILACIEAWNEIHG
ncbi:YoaK family protein [Oxalicibacterium solurbis]|uniref:DUF1275 family protein n=1 Tax=Oxalicibacterium solurbis TaxID=69280 RepID=A0A8J3F6M5_9BURK|nr:YoaK family protein [Oxalicibacterium solurbis]GGI55003.1 DUF1275 family protein [Oxalicibacterium solurbis]